MDRETASSEPLDLQWLGRPRRIAAWRVGDVLVDCGPRTSVDQLLEAVGEWRPRALLLTHIHLDHAGAAGALVARWPDLEIWVHRRGARHLIDPERLVASARRVFGDAFDRKFGGMDPVPEANIRPIDGGERMHGFLSLYTPGHASHHVAYLHEATGRGFVGDAAAVRLAHRGPVLPPTPPPDIDVGQWLASVDALAAWGAASFGLPHFGSVDDAEAHLDAVRTALRRHADAAASLDQVSYVDAMEGELMRDAVGELLDDYLVVVPLDQNYVGLRRSLERR
jgi:glyoxylase-like metal-dependent hydrolase (beta-lactamase superfamily II)